jgi:hypothetical protein
MANATDHRCMSEAVLVVVGLFAVAMLSWALSHRPDWWRVPTELHGFLWFGAAIVLFFAFNLFAFSYLPGSPFLWFLLSFVAFGWFSFRIHEEFDSSLTGDGGAANSPRSSVPAAMTRVGRWYSSLSKKAAVANPRAIIDLQRRATGRGEHRQATEIVSIDAELLGLMRPHHRQRRHPRQP